MADVDDVTHAPSTAPQRQDEWLYYDALNISERRRRVDAIGVALITPLAVIWDYTVVWGREHWVLLFNVGNLILFLGTFVSPTLNALGWSALAQPTFDVYHILCLQRPTHSFFLWGFQMSMEERMVAIPATQAMAGLLYAFIARRRALRPLNAWLFLVWSAPMGFDILSQSLGWRDSDWLWRVITGGLFAVASVWLFYPLLAWAWAPTNHTGKVKLRLDGSWHV